VEQDEQPDIRPLPDPPRCRGIALGNGEYSGCAYGYGDIEPFTGPRDGASEDLHIVVARALVHNPNAVLKMTGERWKLERVCGDYDIGESAAKARKRKADVRLAMKRVVAPDLQEKKRACLMAAEK